MPAPDIPALLQRYGLRPQKSLGQNFLIDETALQRVVEAAGIQTGQQVLEIGPGLGSLTRLLAERASRVVCVELDQNLLPPLAEVLQPYPNVQIVQGDILALDPSALMSGAGQRAPLPGGRQYPLLHHLGPDAPPAGNQLPSAKPGADRPARSG